MLSQILVPATGETADGLVFATGLGASAHPSFRHVRQDPAGSAIGLAGSARAHLPVMR